MQLVIKNLLVFFFHFTRLLSDINPKIVQITTVNKYRTHTHTKKNIENSFILHDM